MQRIWAGKKPTESTDSSPPGRRGVLKSMMPRTEVVILLIGFICTVSGKFVLLRRHEVSDLLLGTLSVIYPDIMFFFVVLLLIFFLHVLTPVAVAARCALLIAVSVSAWSIVDATWLIKCGAQLQPAVVMLLFHCFWEFWPLVQNNFHARPILGASVITVALGVIGLFIWRFIRPCKTAIGKRTYAICALTGVLLIASVSLVRLVLSPRLNIGLIGSVLASSSHRFALVDVIAGHKKKFSEIEARNVLRAGRRKVVLPQGSPEELPNVVIVLMETIPYSISSLSGPDGPIMPSLARMAEDGVEFRSTRIPTARSNKAVWAMLTSTSPSMQYDYVEAVNTDPPYESLLTILGRAGYRSAHFEMARGTFECAPALYHNLGFDWAWFRDNLEDASSHLGHFAGDDCRMIEPVFDWASESSAPFVLLLNTSVAHGPGTYDLPEWFAKEKNTQYEKYIETVKYTDHFLGEFLAALKARGLEERTIVCVLADHGGSFRNGADNERWTPYEEVMRVPWIMRWPGRIDAGRVIMWPCSQLDVTPTILKLIGCGIDQAGFEGNDAFDPSDPSRRLYFASWFFDSPAGFVEGDRKVVYWPSIDKAFEFDLKSDPNEEEPRTMAKAQTERVKEDIVDWQHRTYITVGHRHYEKRFLYSHWWTYSAGEKVWAYYVPSGSASKR
jgi:phosphoglycerol transferase MdoB-like AlkP superfamily enzyme